MAISKPDFKMYLEMTPRELSDQHSMKTLLAFHDECIRQADVKARYYYSGAKIAKLREMADLFQQAIDYKDSEGA